MIKHKKNKILFFKLALFMLALAVPAIGWSQNTGFVNIYFAVKTPEKITIDNLVISIQYKDNPQRKTFSGNTVPNVLVDTSKVETISFYNLAYDLKTISKADLLVFLKTKQPEYEIILKKKNIDLKEVEVKSTASVPFYQERNMLVADYDILANGNVLLVGDSRIYLVSPNNSIIDTVENKQNIDSIIQDCSGKIYLKNRRHLFAVNIKNNVKILISDNPLLSAEVQKTITSIKACNKQIRMKEVVGAFNQQIYYFLQVISDKRVNYNFYLAEDLSRIEVAADQRQRLIDTKVPERMGEITWKQNRVIKDKMHMEWIYEFFTIKKTFAPIFMFRDTIYIFDHTIHKINVFTYQLSDTVLQFSKIIEDSITYSKKQGWKNYIIQDRYSGKFYTMYQDDDLVLRSIPINNKGPIENIVLPKRHYFSDKLKIYNHCVYYLWRNASDPLALRTLYKYNSP